MADAPVSAQAPVLLDDFGEQRVGMDRAFHDRFGLAFEDHRDRLRRGGVGIGHADERKGGNVRFELFRRGLDSAGIADQNRFDQAILRRQHDAAERVAVLGADDGGFQRRQLGRKPDQISEMVGGVDDERRQIARFCNLGDGRRLDLRGSVADNVAGNVLDLGVEHSDRLFALLPANNDGPELVSDMDAAQKTQILCAIERSRAWQQVAEHGRQERTDPHRWRDRLCLGQTSLRRGAASAD